MIVKRKSDVTELTNSFVLEQGRLQEEQRRKRRGLKRRLSFLALIVVFLGGVFSFIFHTQASLLDEKTAEKVQLEEQLEQLQREEAMLQEEIRNYHDREYIAEIARRDYYLSNEGEVLFKLAR